MPKALWDDIDVADIDDFDRDSVYKPYTGPVPPNGVYRWRIKIIKYAPATNSSHPQLRIGLELKARTEEKRYNGYFIMAFLHVTQKARYRWVPFLDTIGVTGKAFKHNTHTDEEGNVTRIGKWRPNADEVILARLAEQLDQNGEKRKDITWFGAYAPNDDEEEYDDDDDEEEYDDEDEEYVDEEDDD